MARGIEAGRGEFKSSRLQEGLPTASVSAAGKKGYSLKRGCVITGRRRAGDLYQKSTDATRRAKKRAPSPSLTKHGLARPPKKKARNNWLEIAPKALICQDWTLSKRRLQDRGRIAKRNGVREVFGCTEDRGNQTLLID